MVLVMNTHDGKKTLFISDKISFGAAGYVFHTDWLKGY